ncbi:MAG TPA: PKD domain-containing protein [Gemmatimonadales bacterium]|nr:PKD domain-containing protein [Gemmatimonadales bacterium]
MAHTRQVGAIHGTPWLPRRVLAWLGAAALAGCGGSDLVLPDTGGAAAIRVVAGDGQRGAVGEPLDAPVVVEVSDEAGDPVAGVGVGFTLTSAGSGGEVTPATAVTDAAGRAQAHVLLGDKVGLQTGEARVMGASPAPATSFAALASSGTPGGTPPTAGFTWACDGLSCQFSDASTDDGTLTAWLWRFGDGSTSTEQNPSHQYDSGGSYGVTLAVTDDEGESDIASNQVSVTAPPPSNAAPHAEFSVSCEELTCSFTDQSTDADGTIAGRAWDFGDGATSTEQSPSHTYAAGGQYSVTLRVTDDDGAQDSRTHPASPTAPAPEPNEPPQADFDVHCKHQRCDFTDKSKDDDGTVVSWAWDFGDGATSTEENPSHSYAGPGHYDVELTVTDDRGATAGKSKRVDVKR